MLAYLGVNASTSKKNKAEKKAAVDERLICFKDYIELSEKLQKAKDKIQELESSLVAKEQLHDELHKKVELLTTTIEKEKTSAKEKQTQYTEEEDVLNDEIASLKLDLMTQESHYETLKANIIELQAQREQQLLLQEQHKSLQIKLDEKEREYEILVNKMTELESEKKAVEDRLTQEKNEHQETKSALEVEKKARKLGPMGSESQKSKPMFTSTLFNNNNKIINQPILPHDLWNLYSGY